MANARASFVIVPLAGSVAIKYSYLMISLLSIPVTRRLVFKA